MASSEVSLWIDVFASLARVFADHETELSRLDSGLGDGDHGVNMRRGFAAVCDALEQEIPTSRSEVMAAASRVLMECVGGAMGPIMGSFWAGLADTSGRASTLGSQLYAAMLAAGLQRVQSLGKAKPGDKTLVDALAPAVEAARQAAEAGRDVAQAASEAAVAAHKGAEATAQMVARHGRARFLGERALGQQDPGATSMALVLQSFANALAAPCCSDLAVDDAPGSLVVRSAHGVQARIEKSTGMLSIVDQATGAELRFAQPLCLLSEQRDALYIGPVLSWRHEGDTVLVELGAGQNGSEALLAVTFPLRSSCQITLSTSAGAATGARLALHAAADEHFCGGGERFARVDQRGLRFPCWADDQAVSQSGGHPWTYFPVPFFISSKGYALALHTTYRSDWDLCAGSDDRVVVDIAEPRLCCEFYFGDQPLTLIDLYTQRTGRPMLPPRWNNGVWRTCLGGQKAVMAEAHRLRSEGIPCSALWVYDANDARGNVGWPICKMHHSGHYDDIAETVRQLHALGYKVQTYLFPYYYEDTPHYADAEAKGYFLKNGDGSTLKFPFFSVIDREPYRRVASIVDFTNPEAKAWWQEAIRYVLVDLGFDGWMHDFGENIPDDIVAFDGRSGRALHNAYPVLYQQAAREMCTQVKPDASFYARSGYAGSQNWLTAAWTGDQICNWAPGEGLPSALVACLSLGISGIPYIGPDIGGYFSDSFAPGSQAFSEELWQRWTQLGALCSIMRDHLGDKPEGSAELWTSEATIACFRRYARLHMSLSPYLQLLAREAHETGAPIMRHMMLAVPNEPWAWSCDDQYMLGKDLLVAPVLVEGPRSRTVRLPDGLWVDFWEGLPYQGGCDVEVAAPLERIPLFWRAGALVPTLLNPADTVVGAEDPAVRSADDDINLLLCLPAQWPAAGPLQGRTALALADGTGFTCTWSPDEIRLSSRGGSERRCALTIPCDWRAAKATVAGEPAQLRRIAGLPELGQGYRNAQAWQVRVAGGHGESELVITGGH